MSFTAEGTLTPSEVVRFQYAHAYWRSWPRALFLAVVAMLMPVLLVIVAIERASSLKVFGPMGLLFMGFAAFALLMPRDAARTMLAANRNLSQPMRFDFTDEGVTVTSAEAATGANWSDLHHISETNNLFLVYRAADGAWILPKRYFVSPAEADRWKEFAIAHLGNPDLFEKPVWYARWL